MYLIANSLIVNQNTIFYEFPFLALYTFIVIAHGAK
jgi:hypothetical protein